MEPDERQPEVEGQIEMPAIFNEPGEAPPPPPRPLAVAASILRLTGIGYTIFPNGILFAMAISHGIDGSTLFLLILALLPAMFLRCEATDLLHLVLSARKRAPITLLWVSLIELGLLWVAVRAFNAFLAQRPFTVQGLSATADRISPILPLGIFALIAGMLVYALHRQLTHPDLLDLAPPASRDDAPFTPPLKR